MSGKAVANRDGRVPRTSIVVPFCIGNITHAIQGKNPTPGAASHAWKLYVRDPDNVDLSHIIAKVSFTLHNSFAKPLREFTAPPFEVREEGWGEFDVQIRIDFAEDAQEPPLKLAHRLKLFHEEEKARDNPRKPVIRETYDEIVFWEPPEAFYNRVMATRKRAAPGDHDKLCPVYDEKRELQMLQNARMRVADERANMMEILESQGT